MPRLRVSRRQGRRRLEMPELWQGRRGVRRLVMSRRSYRRARHAMHVCGNTKAIVADLVTTGADALELDYKTDVRRARGQHPRHGARCPVVVSGQPRSASRPPGVEDVRRGVGCARSPLETLTTGTYAAPWPADGEHRRGCRPRRRDHDLATALGLAPARPVSACAPSAGQLRLWNARVADKWRPEIKSAPRQSGFP